jgi:hypothetical protein
MLSALESTLSLAMEPERAKDITLTLMPGKVALNRSQMLASPAPLSVDIPLWLDGEMTWISQLLASIVTNLTA